MKEASIKIYNNINLYKIIIFISILFFFNYIIRELSITEAMNEATLEICSYVPGNHLYIKENLEISEYTLIIYKYILIFTCAYTYMYAQPSLFLRWSR